MEHLHHRRIAEVVPHEGEPIGFAEQGQRNDRPSPAVILVHATGVRRRAALWQVERVGEDRGLFCLPLPIRLVVRGIRVDVGTWVAHLDEGVRDDAKRRIDRIDLEGRVGVHAHAGSVELITAGRRYGGRIELGVAATPVGRQVPLLSLSNSRPHLP